MVTGGEAMPTPVPPPVLDNKEKQKEKKKELQLEFEENERRLLKRSIGNCRFIGELYKQKILTPNIILYCIVNLVKNHDEVSLECSCNLLKTAGEELEQCYCLNDTFDKLKALTSRGMKSKIPPRIKFMIQDVIELRRGKWISEKKDHHPGCNKFKGGEYKKCCRNDNNWNVGPNNTKYKQQNYTIDPPKVLRLQNVKQLGGILWIYNKWITSENVSLELFMSNNQINKYLNKVQVGVFLLSIAIYDKIMLTDNKLPYVFLQSWIYTNFGEEIIKSLLFVQALTIAIVIVCVKLNLPYEDFFDHAHVELLRRCIEFEPLSGHEIQAREVQCMHGIQIMSATLKHPRGMVLKLFNKLYHHRIISKESFELFIQEYEELAGKY